MSKTFTGEREAHKDRCKLCMWSDACNGGAGECVGFSAKRPSNPPRVLSRNGGRTLTMLEMLNRTASFEA